MSLVLRWLWLPMLLAVGAVSTLYAFGVPGSAWAFWSVVAAWALTGLLPMVGYPFANWGRAWAYAKRWGRFCRHPDWSSWGQLDSFRGHVVTCKDCGWIVARRGGYPVYQVVPWRYLAGLTRRGRRNVDRMWSLPRRNPEE